MGTEFPVVSQAVPRHACARARLDVVRLTERVIALPVENILYYGKLGTHQPCDLGVWPAPPCMSIFTEGGVYQDDIPGPAAKGTWGW